MRLLSTRGCLLHSINLSFFFYLHSYGVFVLSKNCRAFTLTSHQLEHTPYNDITMTLNVAGQWQASIRIWVEATRLNLK